MAAPAVLRIRNFTSAGLNLKYASMPYPGCGVSGPWTDAQGFDHFSSHETREAVTDLTTGAPGTTVKARRTTVRLVTVALHRQRLRLQ